MNNTPTETTTETTTVETTEVSTPSTTPTSTREQIYSQYYSTQPQETTMTPGVPGVSEVTETTPPAANPVKAPESIVDVRKIVEETIRSIMPQSTTTPTDPTPTTPTPAASPIPTPVVPEAWVQDLTKGDFATATQKLKEYILSEIRSTVVPEVEKTTLKNATENFQAEQELSRFVNSVREQNPDIVKIEHLLAPAIQIEMGQWAESQGGKFAPAAYVEKYKQVLTAKVDDARQLIQTFRAAGGTEKTTVKQEVLASATLTPSPVQAHSAQDTQPKIQSVSDYIQMREQQNLRRSGMLVK